MNTPKQIQLALAAICVFFCSVLFGQVRPNLIDEDPKLATIFKTENNDKGTVSYTVMQDVLQKNATKIVTFQIFVPSEQRVLIEIRNEDGDLTEILHNDFVPSNMRVPFTLSGENWNGQEHFIRVVTEAFVEVHEVAFR